jgi:hypothetical protein
MKRRVLEFQPDSADDWRDAVNTVIFPARLEAGHQVVAATGTSQAAPVGK